MIVSGTQVEHAEYGIGTVLAVLGGVATVEFFGEALDVVAGELMPRQLSKQTAPPPSRGQTSTDFAFRKSFEAVNLGVVPTDPDQLVDLTIGGEQASDEIGSLLANASKDGVCRIFMGYYGSGKSHHLHLVKAVAIRDGWVTASLELDPKAADPAKPATVYQGLVGGLEFPMRADGSRSADFFDLIKEIRDNWSVVRDLPYFKRSPWFSKGLEALLYLSHRRDDTDYVAAVSWLAGQVKQIGAIRSLSWRGGHKTQIPILPQTKDTGLIYAYNLVVLHEILKALGYKGLALIIDEAEHVRSYSFNRYIRANNFFDIIARCAHAPRKDLQKPQSDYEHFDLPPFWKEGPHFTLFVGLTEGEDTHDLKRKMGEMSVLIHDPKDVVHLEPPCESDYEKWCEAFLAESAGRLGPKVQLLADPGLRARIAATLRHHFDHTPISERILRNWTKMAGFAPAVLMSSDGATNSDELVELVDEAARQIAGEILPWDD
ncbi:BREX system ATP-binding domain-containing protein [Mesorhizobium sp. M1403]|uniref:BREX system ATP-binding domain-containing protein n=1 Tax=Mesorhizobium sp. M1403 TaxID=2957097 RepID=UPI00333C2ADF